MSDKEYAFWMRQANDIALILDRVERILEQALEEAEFFPTVRYKLEQAIAVLEKKNEI